MADEDRNDEREEPEDKELEDDDSDLAKILDDMEVSDEELIEVLLGRNSDCDEAAIKVEAERRIQQTGSVVAAYKSAASQAESAMVDMLAEVEKAAKEFSPLFDLADELAERLEAEAVTEPPAKPEPEPEPEPAPEAKKANEKLN